jgi:putative transposase
MLKRERVHHRHYRTLDEARADAFNYIERFHNPRMRRRVAAQDRKLSAILKPSVETGRILASKLAKRRTGDES